MFVHVKPSKKQRILAFFMAFAIIFVSLPFVGVDNEVEVGAVTAGNGKIIQVPTYSKYMGQSGYENSYGNNGTVNGTYTGKILPISVNMYDYLTDYEINNSNNWNKLSGNQSNYTYYYRYEPYKKFNREISAMSSPGTSTFLKNENIKIVYKSLRFKNGDDVRVYLWDSANSSNKITWPGLAMNYDGTDGDFHVFSINVNLNFDPDRLIFSNNGSDLYKTPDISQSMQGGHKYTFEDKYSSNGHTILILRSSSSSVSKIYFWNDSVSPKWEDRPTMTSMGQINGKYYYHVDLQESGVNFTPKYFNLWGGDSNNKNFSFTISQGYTYVFTSEGDNVSDFPSSYPTDVSCTDDSPDSSQDITVHNSKLYQGYFLADNNNNDPNSYTSARKAENKSNGIISDNNKYSDFYWQANMAQRPIGDDQKLPKASVIGLVDDTLNANGLVKQGGEVLPYFYKSYTSGGTTNDNSLVTKGYMKCWEGTEDKSISFPFYEVLTNAKNAAGGDENTTQKATFYQFNLNGQEVPRL